MVALAEAQLHYAEGDYEEAIAAAVAAETSFVAAETWSRLLPARWLRGESHRQAGRHGEAAVLLEATVRDATAHDLPQVAQRCSTSLGLLAVQEGDLVAAEAHFKHAVEIIEALRAPLPAETFRTAFVADKQTPYAELVRLCLAAGSASTATKTVTGGCQADTPEHPPEHTPEGRRVERDIEAFRYVERARSRALVDVLAGALPARPAAHDPFDARLVARLDELREELNWFYSQMNRPPVAGAGPDRMAALEEAVRGRESLVLETERQLQQRGGGAALRVEPVDVARLQRDLGPASALVEYFSLDGELLAFVVTEEGIEVVRRLGQEADVEAALQQLRFQMNSLRYGARRPAGSRSPRLAELT
ncbi:MAG: hypothetical protein M3442_18040, partial [Chloroflexota bacterium]|nr:hypothetical protein [Chloroflexota bacterium]